MTCAGCSCCHERLIRVEIQDALRAHGYVDNGPSVQVVARLMECALRDGENATAAKTVQRWLAGLVRR